MRTLRRTDLLAPAEVVAPRLLGARVLSTVGGARVAIRLTEVEAYGGVAKDPGSHAFRRRTPRNATMFGPPGHAYVYFTYGMHWCLNIVTGSPGDAGAVLIRAGEVVEGIDVARARRGANARDRDLARGPARLTVALGVTGDLDGSDLLQRASPVRLLSQSSDPLPHEVGPRTGVGGAGAGIPWRFSLTDEPTVSPYRAATRRRR